MTAKHWATLISLILINIAAWGGSAALEDWNQIVNPTHVFGLAGTLGATIYAFLTSPPKGNGK